MEAFLSMTSDSEWLHHLMLSSAEQGVRSCHCRSLTATMMRRVTTVLLAAYSADGFLRHGRAQVGDGLVTRGYSHRASNEKAHFDSPTHATLFHARGHVHDA